MPGEFLDEVLDDLQLISCLSGLRLVFSIKILVEATELQQQEVQDLLRLTQHALNDLNDFSGHRRRSGNSSSH